jgi:hypothetical protein
MKFNALMKKKRVLKGVLDKSNDGRVLFLWHGDGKECVGNVIVLLHQPEHVGPERLCHLLHQHGINMKS